VTSAAIYRNFMNAPIASTAPRSISIVNDIAGTGAATGFTTTVAVARLFAGFGSGAPLETDAVFDVTVVTVRTRLNVADAPDASVAIEQVIVAPFVQVNEGPEV